MNETYVTVAGNVATKVDHWTSPSGVPVARFRLASTARRFDRRKECWTDASTSFYTVWAWRGLATNVASSVARGEPVVVRGQLRIVEEEREGRRYLSADLMASTVGHDLTRGTSAFVRVSRANPELTQVPGMGGPGAAGGPEFTRGPAPAWPPPSVEAAGPSPFGSTGEGAGAPGAGSACEEGAVEEQLVPDAVAEGSVPGQRGAS
ncbi:single-stranded DNA-binding protein [Streptomyces oryzae]|uniref:Single-stranded DNA-binding protein n=1 Tax=Streptomyces oryzae TaxID=1434886 RepID=A0ABS3XMR8_9ACTN|nr:single-stranded DNA-binding protein [Streptomyces oryzae]MBO8196693.1 single-stranded DNA-binding protein [Streptomyces oryzae]